MDDPVSSPHADALAPLAPTPHRVVELVVNLDDVTGEVIGHAVQTLLDEGALDVWTTAIQMKKQRPGVQLSVLAREAHAAATARRVLELTGSFGVRYRPWDRLVLDREHQQVDTPYGPLPVKVGSLEGQPIAVRPEFEPARAAAQNADETDFVRAAAAFAAAQMIRPADPDAPPPVVPAGVDLGPLAGLLWSERAGMRANAAVLLGETGSPSARPMLRDAAKRPTPRAARTDQTLLELQISEALVKLGEEDQLKALRLAAYSKDDEVRVLAVLMLGRLDDQTMEGALLGFLKQDPQELRLAAAQALGHMGWPDGLPAALKGATSDLERIRAQSALALGRAMTAIPATDSVHDTQARVAAYTALDRLLSDPAASVRLSAAAAVLEPAP